MPSFHHSCSPTKCTITYGNIKTDSKPAQNNHIHRHHGQAPVCAKLSCQAFHLYQTLAAYHPIPLFTFVGSQLSPVSCISCEILIIIYRYLNASLPSTSIRAPLSHTYCYIWPTSSANLAKACVKWVLFELSVIKKNVWKMSSTSVFFKRYWCLRMETSIPLTSSDIINHATVSKTARLHFVSL